MRHREHQGARALTLVGLLATLAYLVWRTGWSMTGAPLWLALPVLAVEVVGFAAAAVLAWALWPAPRATSAEDDPDGRPAHASPAVSALVRVQDEPAHEVRATVLATRAVRGVGEVRLVDTAGRADLAPLAAELGVEVVRAGHGVHELAALAGSPVALVVAAGDIPAMDLVDRLLPHLADPRVAVVQGMGTSYAADSPEHGPNQRHELLFERSGLNPALGSRGLAVWTGSGSLVRTDALRDVPTTAATPAAALDAWWGATADLHAAGWRIVAPRATVIAQRSLPDEAAVHVDRAARTRAARRLVAGAGGALRGGGRGPAARLALLAWAVRPLSGVRRTLFIALLCGALLAGAAPFTAPGWVVFGLWLPGFCYSSLGLALLSGWSLRPGDRTRWSLHTMGSAWAGLRSQHSPSRQPVLVAPGTVHTAGLTFAVVALGVVLAMRGISDRFTHTLGELPQLQLLALLVVSLWVLAMSLDLLRVLARRSQLRRSPRVVAALTAALGDRGVSVVDLTPLGAGVLSHVGLQVGERLLLETSIPSRTGVTAARIPCVVRNVVPRAAGEWRVGLEFGDVDAATAAALAEYCVVEPMWERMGTMPGRSVTEAREIVYLPEPDDPGPGRMTVRLVALMAVAGAVGSTVPGTVEAAGVRHWSGTVVAVGEPASPGDGGVPLDSVVADSLVDHDEPVPATEAPVVASETADPQGVPGAVVWAVCSLDAGADGAWGTADDVYGAPYSVVTGPDGGYDLTLDGTVCWASVAPPAGYVPEGAAGVPGEVAASAPQPVVLEGEAVREVRLVATAPEAAADPQGGRGSLGDLVWLDLDRDGRQDGGEPGVAGVRLTLLDAAGAATASTVTDRDGRFVFTDLTDGDYRLAVAGLPNGTRFAAAAAAGDSRRDSDVDVVTGRSAAVTVAGGATVDGVDVGLVEAGVTGAGERPAAASPEQGSERVLPAPDAPPAPGGDPWRGWAVAVLLLAGLLALSILLGLVRPRGMAAVRVR